MSAIDLKKRFLNMVLKCILIFLGSLGDKFYIILQGQVSVLIPNPEIKEVHQQIENSRKFIDEKRNQLKDLHTLID